MRNVNAMIHMTALMSASLLGGDTFGSPSRAFPASKRARPCLRCGVMHQHNNSFCSTECCRSYAAEKKSGVVANSQSTTQGQNAQSGASTIA